MLFKNRVDAGKQLALKVEHYLCGIDKRIPRSHFVVVGLPRGGVPVALEVSRRLGCPLEVIVSKKLPFPNEPEYAIGAVCTGAIVVLNPEIPKSSEWNEYIERQKQALLASVQSREDEFYLMAGKHRTSIEEKTAIIVDDGIATGMTALAAIEAARKRGASKVIMAAPIVSKESDLLLRRYCDDVLALCIPETFDSVGRYYNDFKPTTDEEVVKALAESNNSEDCPNNLKSAS